MDKYGTLEEKQPLYRIHFTDEIGSATIEAETAEQFEEIKENIEKDPLCTDIWFEYWDEEEGWQA